MFPPRQAVEGSRPRGWDLRPGIVLGSRNGFHASGKYFDFGSELHKITPTNSFRTHKLQHLLKLLYNIGVQARLKFMHLLLSSA